MHPISPEDSEGLGQHIRTNHTVQEPARMSTKLIDVHHHLVPPFYAAGKFKTCDLSLVSEKLTCELAITDAGGDPSGWSTPIWTLEGSEDLMKSLSIGTTIFSITAPGPCIVQGEASVKLARTCNEFTASIRDKDPSKFGFFVSLPDLLFNKEAALEELRYGLDVLHGDGVILFTRYGNDNHYLGHPDLAWIWDELDARKAVVFIHPTTPVDKNRASPFMPQPMIDYPFETTRTAVDLIVSNTMKTHRNCKIILSHAGGMLPWIAYRPAVMIPFVDSPLNKSTEEFLEEASSFYFDLALSTAEPVVELLLKFAKPGHVMYGSDFPYAPTGGIEWFAKSLRNQRFGAREEYNVSRGNAEVLFPRLNSQS